MPSPLRIATKTSDEVRAMRQAGLIVAAALDAARGAATVGATPRDLDRIAERTIRDAGAVPSFLGYDGYPASLCVSVGDVVVHGIPDEVPFADGDIVSIDCGAIWNGWHGDAAITVPIGTVDDVGTHLIDATRASLWAGIAAMAHGRHVRDIGVAVDAAVRDAGGNLGVLEDYVGHGIGREMHMDPDVPNYPTRSPGPRLRPGITLAIEPMVVEGSIATRIEADGWTVRTADGGRAAHWEHTVARTDHGVWVLTAKDGGAEGLAAHGLMPTAV
ncbi:MAG: type I methionyl aminopeptidase [Bifidobacteriaceae bacterium]|jgi:methionyl aminopeptidase|nr:type I methionyl aminopeptidase [Bifidobacteriaceae bacterium]